MNAATRFGLQTKLYFSWNLDDVYVYFAYNMFDAASGFHVRLINIEFTDTGAVWVQTPCKTCIICLR